MINLNTKNKELKSQLVILPSYKCLGNLSELQF
jgi:hypothetical protein